MAGTARRRPGEASGGAAAEAAHGLVDAARGRLLAHGASQGADVLETVDAPPDDGMTVDPALTEGRGVVGPARVWVHHPPRRRPAAPPVRARTATGWRPQGTGPRSCVWGGALVGRRGLQFVPGGRPVLLPAW